MIQRKKKEMWHSIKSLVIFMAIILAVSGDCGKLPEIRHSGKYMSGTYLYHEGYTVEYYCLPGYRPEGNATYVCSGGKWIGGPFSCLIKKCPPLGSPVNGKRIGESYEVGSVMRFKCDTGYDMIGSNTSQCQTNSKWQPPNIPKCRIKKCPAVLSIKHGNVTVEHKVNGQNDVYGTVLKVQCLGNFIRSGPARMYCTKNGLWTKEPKCESVSCPPYPGLDSGCVLRTELEAANTLLLLYCTEQSTMKGKGTASCYNNTWDDLSMECLCDCQVKANTDLVRLQNLNPSGLLKRGETLKWSCKNGATKATTAPLTCIDGTIETPLCLQVDTTLLTTANPINGNKKENIDMITTENGDKEKTVPVLTIVLITILVIVVIIIAVIIVMCRKGKTSNCTNRKTDGKDSNNVSDIDANTGLVQSEERHGAGEEIPLCQVEPTQNGAVDTSQEITKKSDSNWFEEWKERAKTAASQDDGSCANADVRQHTTETEGEVELTSVGPSPLSPEHNLLQDSTCATPSGKSKGQRNKVTEKIKEEHRSYRIKNLCPNCNNTVQPAELKRASGKVWHAKCFKCYTCKNPLFSGTVTEHDDQIYCGSCHSKQFGRKRTTQPI